MNHVNDDNELAKLGNLFLDSNKFEDAIRCYNDALVSIFIVEKMMNQGYKSEFFFAFQKKNELNETCYKKRATSYWNLKKFDEAILDLVTFLEIEPTDIAVQADLCELLSDAGRHTEANTG